MPEPQKCQINQGTEVLAIDPKYFRPTEVDLLIGDPTKAKEKLGWEPKIQLAELVEDMMSSDLKLMQKDKYLEEGGYQTLNYFGDVVNKAKSTLLVTEAWWAPLAGERLKVLAMSI